MKPFQKGSQRVRKGRGETKGEEINAFYSRLVAILKSQKQRMDIEINHEHHEFKA